MLQTFKHFPLKVMVTIFWARKCILLVEFLPREAINAERYCAVLTLPRNIELLTRLTH